MSVARSYIRGPRFALRSTDPAKVRACLGCVYGGQAEHAEWCEKRISASPDPARPPGPDLTDVFIGPIWNPPEFTHEPITAETLDRDAHLFGVTKGPSCM